MPLSLLWLSVGAFAIGTEGLMIAGLIPAIADDLGVSIPLAGHLVTIFALAYAVGSPLIAVATGGLDRKIVLLGASLGFALANLVAASSSSFAALAASRVLLALCAGAFMPAASGYAASTVAPELRGRALATIYCGFTAAIVVGVPLGAVLGGRLGWRATFVGVAILTVPAILGIAAALPRQRGVRTAGLRDRLAIARRPAVLAILLQTALGLAGAFCVYTYLAPFLTAAAGFTGDAVAITLAVFGVGAAAGNLLGGYASDRWDPRRVLMVVFAVLAAAFVVLSIAGQFLPAAAAAPVAVVAVGVWGLAGWGLPPAQQTRLVRLEPALAPVTLSLYSSSVYVGTSVGAALGSGVVALGSVTSIGWVGAACELAGLVALAVSWRQCIARVREAASAAPPPPFAAARPAAGGGVP